MRFWKEEFVKELTNREYFAQMKMYRRWYDCDPCANYRHPQITKCLFPHCFRIDRKSWKYYRAHQYRCVNISQ